VVEQEELGSESLNRCLHAAAAAAVGWNQMTRALVAAVAR